MPFRLAIVCDITVERKAHLSAVCFRLMRRGLSTGYTSQAIGASATCRMQRGRLQRQLSSKLVVVNTHRWMKVQKSTLAWSQWTICVYQLISHRILEMIFSNHGSAARKRKKCQIAVLDLELFCGRAEQDRSAYSLYVYQYISIGQSGERIHFRFMHLCIIKNLTCFQLCVLL
jgi:hypothetical protein